MKVTRMIETATQDYYDTHFYARGEKERRQVKEYQTQLADQKRQLADQKQQLAAKDQYIKMLEEQLEKAKKQESFSMKGAERTVKPSCRPSAYCAECTIDNNSRRGLVPLPCQS